MFKQKCSSIKQTLFLIWKNFENFFNDKLSSLEKVSCTSPTYTYLSITSFLTNEIWLLLILMNKLIKYTYCLHNSNK